MPSIEDVLALLNVPILEYILYPHLRRSMRLKVKPIHKVKFHGNITIIINIVYYISR